MRIESDRIVLDKPASDLDRLILSVAEHLESRDIEYSVVSGYVAVLFGRARSTEDIDVIVERFDEETAENLGADLKEDGFWGPAMALSTLYETLLDEVPIRIAMEETMIPSVELKWPTDRYDRASIDESVTVVLPEGSLEVGSIELQIAYKLSMGARRDREDALHLLEVFQGTIDESAMERYVTELGVEEEYARLS